MDEGRLSVWVTVFRFGIFIAGVLVWSGNGTEGRDLSVWCVRAVKGKLIPGIIIGGQYMPREFWDDAPAYWDDVPACWVEGVLIGVESIGGLMGGTDVPDGLIWVSVGGELDVMSGIYL